MPNELTEQSVKVEATSVIQRINSFTITSRDTYEEAGTLKLACARAKKSWLDWIEPICTTAHKAWKQTVAKRDEIMVPIENAEKKIKRQMAEYDDEQRRIAAQKEAEIREAQRKAEEDRILAAAAQAEKTGDTEAVEQILAQPVEVQPVIVESNVPKMKGITFRTIWKFRIVDADKLPRDFCCPDEKKLQKYATAMQDKAKVEGVEFYSERV